MKRVVSTLLGAALLLGSTSLTFAAKEGELLVWIGTNRDEAALQSVIGITPRLTAELRIRPMGLQVSVQGGSGKLLPQGGLQEDEEHGQGSPGLLAEVSDRLLDPPLQPFIAGHRIRFGDR